MGGAGNATPPILNLPQFSETGKPRQIGTQQRVGKIVDRFCF